MPETKYSETLESTETMSPEDVRKLREEKPDVYVTLLPYPHCTGAGEVFNPLLKHSLLLKTPQEKAMLNWKVKRYDNHKNNPIDRWEARTKAVWEPGDVERVHIIQAQYPDMEREELGTYESDPKAKPEFYIVLCRLQGYSGGSWFAGPEIFRRVFRTLREAKKYVSDKCGSRKPTCLSGRKRK